MVAVSVAVEDEGEAEVAATHCLSGPGPHEVGGAAGFWDAVGHDRAEAVAGGEGLDGLVAGSADQGWETVFVDNVGKPCHVVHEQRAGVVAARVDDEEPGESAGEACAFERGDDDFLGAGESSADVSLEWACEVAVVAEALSRRLMDVDGVSEHSRQFCG